MLTRLFVKTSLLGSFGSVAYASTIVHIPDNENRESLSQEISSTQKTKYSTTKPEETTFEDIEMFEKDKGCKLVFVEDFKKNKSYTPRGWFNQRKEKNPQYSKKSIMGAVTYAFNYHRNKCTKKGQILVLEKYPYQNFNPKEVWT